MLNDCVFRWLEDYTDVIYGVSKVPINDAINTSRLSDTSLTALCFDFFPGNKLLNLFFGST